MAHFSSLVAAGVMASLAAGSSAADVGASHMNANASAKANVSAQANVDKHDKDQNKNDEKNDDKKPKPVLDTAKFLACMQTAVVAREKAIADAYHSFSVSMEAALSARGTALTAAWKIQVQADREAAIKLAWKNFNDARKDASTKLRTSDKNAWATFVKAKINCRDTSTVEPTGEQS